jgi:hypothetical protein
MSKKASSMKNQDKKERKNLKANLGTLNNKVAEFYKSLTSLKAASALYQKTGKLVALENTYFREPEYPIREANEILEENDDFKKLNDKLNLINTKSTNTDHIEVDSFGTIEFFNGFRLFVVGEVSSRAEGRYTIEKRKKQLLSTGIEGNNEDLRIIMQKMAQLERIVLLLEKKNSEHSPILVFLSSPIFACLNEAEQKV